MGVKGEGGGARLKQGKKQVTLNMGNNSRVKRGWVSVNCFSSYVKGSNYT